MILKKDSFILGIIIGTISPAILYALMQILNSYLGDGIQASTVGLVSIFGNLFLMRFFLIKKESDKTGRGILFITFIYAIIFIANYLI